MFLKYQVSNRWLVPGTTWISGEKRGRGDFEEIFSPLVGGVRTTPRSAAYRLS
jgi:hypothetical protein